jgi:protein involved in polysaccharide export with SLBB domain
MTQRTKWIAGLAISLITASCSSSDGGLPRLELSAPGAYRLGPGDELRVSVFGLDTMTNSYAVDDTGAVALPIIGAVPVAGKTLREAESLIADRVLARNLVIDPRVTAQVQTYRPFFIAGEVQKPGQYPYVPGMSLMTAVSIAGGYTFRADTRQAMVTRTARRGVATQETPILPGDSIIVREGWF